MKQFVSTLSSPVFRFWRLRKKQNKKRTVNFWGLKPCRTSTETIAGLLKGFVNQKRKWHSRHFNSLERTQTNRAESNKRPGVFLFPPPPSPSNKEWWPFFRAWIFFFSLLWWRTGDIHKTRARDREINNDSPSRFIFFLLTSLWPRLSNAEMKVWKRNPNKDDV